MSNGHLIGEEELGGMRDLDIDFMGMSETNINWTQDARDSFHTAANLLFNSAARCIMASCPSNKAGYLPGGTATVIRGNMCGRLQARGSDHMGRFTWAALRGRNDTGIIAVTVYRVCQRAGTDAGQDTAYMQQWRAMRAAGIKSPDPRNAVLSDVSDVLAEWGQRGYHPMVLIDGNSPIDEKYMERFCAQHGLVDIIKDTHDAEAPPTFSQGRHRIDYILGNDHVRRAAVRAGALPLHAGVTSSDHTLQFVDFDSNLLFGDKSFVPFSGYQREFRLYDVRRKKLFQDKLAEIYRHQKIKERVAAMADRFEAIGTLTPQDIVDYQVLDTEIVEAIKSAAAASGRKDIGYQRSEALCMAGRRVRLHKSILSCCRRNTAYNEKIKELASTLEYTLPDRAALKLKDALRNVRDAWKSKREIQRNDAEERASWLEKLAEEKAKESGKEVDFELTRMIRAARSRGMYKKLRAILKPGWSQLDYIEVPTGKWYLDSSAKELYEFDDGIFVAHSEIEEDVFDPIGSIKVPPNDVKEVQVQQTEHAIAVTNPNSIEEIAWQRVTKPVEIESWLLRRNKRHLQQMYIEGSPPTTEPFSHILDNYGSTPIVDQILDGTYDVDSLDMSPEMTAFIKSLKQTPEEKAMKIPKRMPAADFQETMRLQDENTTSSPCGLHYTLWKALAEIDDFAEIHSLWASLPFMYGFVCERWRKEIDCMLEKKAGVRKIHILRIIGLMESEWNATLKWMYNTQVMPNAEASGLSPNQWGGRKGRSALACALRKIITWEYYRYVKQTVAAFPGDLQSNFDRMLASLNSIISRKFGLSKEAGKCRAETVEKFIRPVKTAAGVSEATYQYNTGDTKLGGEVQGKPDNMQLWTITSSLLFKIHDGMCKGATMLDVTKSLRSRRTLDGYVDDTDNIEDAPETNTAVEARDNIQHNAQTWVNLSAVVGQASAFHKCFWQLLTWQSVGGYYLPTPRNKFADLDLRIKDHRGIASTIKYKHYNEPNEGLGISCCPNGDQKYEFGKRLKQAKNFAARVSTTHLRLGEAWTAVKVNIIPSLCYPFAVTRFSVRQLKQLAVLIDNAFLPKLGINRKMRRIAVYAPLELGGINYPSIASIQDQKNISFVVRQLQLGKELSTDLRILISQAQLESGMVDPVLDDTKVQLPYLEPGLVSHLRERLNEIDGSIVIEGQWQPDLQRENDDSIMKRLAQLPGVKKSELAHANQCRKWTRTITIAELADLSGKFIPPERLTGRWRATSTLEWPRQPIPTKEMWDTYRRLLKRALCKGDMRARVGQPIYLDRKLGKWYQARRHIQYEAYRTRQVVFRRTTSTGPSIFDRYTTTELQNYFTKEDVALQVPKEAHPTSLTEGTEGKWFPDYEYECTINQARVQALRGDDADEEVEESNLDMLRRATKLIACSDGSFDPLTRRAAFNWRIVNEEGKGLVTMSAPVNTNPKYLNSYRAEFAGLRSLLRYAKRRGLHMLPIEVNCDSESCIDTICKGPSIDGLTNLEKAEADIIQSIFEILKEFANPSFHWVEAHQDDDDDTPLEERPLEVQLNIACDLAAKECMRRSSHPEKRPAPLEGTKATLYLGKNMVTTKMTEQIQFASQEREMREYICDVMEWTDDQFHVLNTEAMGRAKARLPLARSIRTSKMLYDWLNVGTQKIKLGKDGTCACCGAATEDFIHLYHCENAEMKETLKASIAELKSKLVADQIPSAIYNGFIGLFCRAAHQSHPDPNYSGDTEDVERVVAAQETMGSIAILKGFHHTDWVQILHKYWEPPPQPRSRQEKKPRKKDAVEQSVSLLMGVWNIFEALWKKRNEILHGEENMLTERIEDVMTERLLEIRSERFALLRRTDHFVIEHPVSEVIKWARHKKKAVLQTLEQLMGNYKMELRREEERLRPITDFFAPINSGEASAETA